MTDTPQTATPPDPRARWVAMGILLVAGFMNLIDVTIVNVALPSMQEAFAATPEQIEWVVAVYILVFALCLIPGGRFGDIYGRRNVFIAGVVVFTIGSAFCGLAPTIEALVGARVVQGIGGAMMIPQTLALVPALFPPEERGAAFALFGLSAGLASVTGPVLGGLLIGADLWGLDWRPIFLVNIPVGLAAILLALRFLPRVGRRRDLGIDAVGILLAGVTLLMVVFPLIEGRALGWPLWCFLMMAGAVPMAFLFARWQRRQAEAERPELLPASLLANRTYLLGVLITALLFSGVPGFFLIMALFLQNGFGLTPLESGLTTMPFSFGVLAASLVAGRLGNRLLRPRITAGGLSVAIGMGSLWIVVGMMEDEILRSAFVLPLLLAGFGLGTAISPLFNTILSSVSGPDSGSASGTLQAFQQVGGAMGVAIVGQIFFTMLEGVPAAGSPAAHLVYERAFSTAIAYPVLSFALLAGAVWLLPRPSSLSPARSQASA
ncbi:MFS transporter [Oceaniglobus trochenteri]|uniref:MFS transporter n=1 Tax=Oceaniglobus trochenteri TaxID=2763260 RepID=UPI001CFF766E|nr:MFS transporter [Oceaniglobus trochenteri]